LLIELTARNFEVEFAWALRRGESGLEESGKAELVGALVEDRLVELQSFLPA
jgi:hypothetical protein